MTILLGVFSPAVACVAAWIAIQSLNTSQRSMKLGQRAYLTYQFAVLNSKEITEKLRADKDFFLNFQVAVSNVGNTPADSIYPRISVARNPNRTPVMVTFPDLIAFELGPKESRVLSGQALFKHVHNARGFPGLSTGFTGQIEFRDVFQEAQVKRACYPFEVSGDSATGGMCGTVMQLLKLE